MVVTPSKSTLLDLVWAVSDFATSDDEIVATVAYLINSSKVQLCGNFAGARIDLSVPTRAVLGRERRGGRGSSQKGGKEKWHDRAYSWHIRAA